jgi:hypothetical protein
MGNRDQFDDILDNALKCYGDVEPRAGLEGRVLARLTEGQVHRHTGWVWALGTAAVATAFGIATIIWVAHSPHVAFLKSASLPQKHETIVTGHSIPDIKAKLALRAAITHPSRRTRGPKVAEEPKLRNFPSARAITGQELMLVDYVRHYPQEALLVVKQQDEFQQQVEQAKKEIANTSISDQ